MSSREERVAKAMLGMDAATVLMTDGYKFSMGQAGFPLRTETFYLSFRRPGRYFIPFDLNEIIQHLLPLPPTTSESHFLNSVGYGLTPAMEAALSGKVVVNAAPKGSWVREREPILTVTGPSFLVSWLEPMAIWLQFPIQVATAMKEAVREFSIRCSCQDEAKIVDLVAAELNKAEFTDSDTKITVAMNYPDDVWDAASELVGAAGAYKIEQRVMEVGMRGATCMAMHRLALHSCMKAGIWATSNVYLAKELGIKAVGTAGHEHQQRWGNDRAAFRALRDMRPGMPSYLFDTFHAKRGMMDAIRVAKEILPRKSSVRFDSGDRDAQFRFLAAADKEAGLDLTYVFMDSITAEAVEHFEALAEELGVSSDRVVYGAGGFLVGKSAPSEWTRDRVSAVYKLCQSGTHPTMKTATESKRSVPGKPVIFRRLIEDAVGPAEEYKDCAGLIGQEDEIPPRGFTTDLAHAEASFEFKGAIRNSPRTDMIEMKILYQRGEGD